MTVRNIRAHQTRGLLPPPVVRGRTGYYNEEHVARIELTREMQADGLNLEAIRRVLEAGDDSASEIFDFTRALRMPFEDESPEIYEQSEVAAAWGASSVDPKLIAPRRKARHDALAARRQARDHQPADAAGGGRARRARRRRRGGDRDRGEAAPQRRRRGSRLRRPLRRGDLEAVRRGRPPRAGLAADPRDARKDAAAGGSGPARRIPDRDGRGGREGERAHPAARGGQVPLPKSGKSTPNGALAERPDA